MDGFNVAAIPEKTNARSPTNLEIKKQDSLNYLEQAWAFIDHQEQEPQYNLNLTKVSMNSKI